MYMIDFYLFFERQKCIWLITNMFDTLFVILFDQSFLYINLDTSSFCFHLCDVCKPKTNEIVSSLHKQSLLRWSEEKKNQSNDQISLKKIQNFSS